MDRLSDIAASKPEAEAEAALIITALKLLGEPSAYDLWKLQQEANYAFRGGDVWED